MISGGLKSLGLPTSPVAPSKPASVKGERSSFGEVLGQSTTNTSTSNTSTTKTSTTNSSATKSSPDGEPTQAFVLDVDGNMLPGQPSAPTLNGPVNDRLLGMAPAEPSLISPGTKQKSILLEDEGVDSLTRRVVWNDFLRKMKDELGVSAEDVLSAFASLSEEQLAQPPEQTVDTVVAALGLNDQQAGVAKNYFTELVTKTGSRSMGDELSTSQRQINLTLMSQKEVSRKTLDRSLEQMNQNFFLNHPQSAERMTPALGVASATSAAPTAKTSALSGEMTKIGEPAFARPDVLSSVNTPAIPAPEMNTVDQLVRQFMSPQAPMTEIPAEVETSISATPLAAETASAGSLKSMLQDLSESMDGEEDGEFTSDASFLAAPIAGEGKTNSLSNAPLNFQGELAKAGQEPVSVNDLVDKAQIMVHDGGGEMKVTLTPEGLGEVALRVTVNEGKVQVQMITESDEAKRLIERQLGDLKGQLSNNHLQLDTIKIDTASNLGKQLEQQYQDAQRQATHNAMEQFRQDTQGWRQSPFEQPSAKFYRGQAEAPRDIQAPSASSRKNINRRLDLVA